MPTVRFGHFVRAAPPSKLGGDATVVQVLEKGTFAAVIDVLGHGADASMLARSIETYLAEHADEELVGLIRRLHARLRGSRGAVAGLCYIDELTGRMRYTGIGNTVVRRIGRREDRLVSRDGVLGQNLRSPLEQDLQLEPGDIVLLYSDGVQSHFDGSALRSLSLDDPPALAREVVSRFGKIHDDAGCIALRYDA